MSALTNFVVLKQYGAGSMEVSAKISARISRPRHLPYANEQSGQTTPTVQSLRCWVPDPSNYCGRVNNDKSVLMLWLCSAWAIMHFLTFAWVTHSRGGSMLNIQYFGCSNNIRYCCDDTIPIITNDLIGSQPSHPSLALPYFLVIAAQLWDNILTITRCRRPRSSQAQE